MTHTPTANVIPPELGLTPDGVFSDPRVVAWRKLGERDNAVLDAGGRRYHLKRHAAMKVWPVVGLARRTPAEAEVAAAGLLKSAGIPTLDVVAWGVLSDGRSYSITADLAGEISAQVWMRRGGRFDGVLASTARLAGVLHSAGLHHKDMYLCHFFVAENGGGGEARLIDVGRVGRLPVWPLDRRWVVKDLAQFVFSMGEFDLPRSDVDGWLEEYGRCRGVDPAGLRGAVEVKVRTIGRHDARLRERAPGRGVSLPDNAMGGVGR